MSASVPSSKPAINISKLRYILATDCGSTTTKAILIECVDGHYRQTQRGEAPTTVEEPFADVTLGVTNSVTELQELSGRRLIADDGTVMSPLEPDESSIVTTRSVASVAVVALNPPLLFTASSAMVPPVEMVQANRAVAVPDAGLASFDAPPIVQDALGVVTSAP